MAKTRDVPADLAPPAEPMPEPPHPEDDHAPLTAAERVEMQQLIDGFSDVPRSLPGGRRFNKSPENYARMQELHARAAYEADHWHEDGEAVDRESLASLDLAIQAIRIIVQTVPAAAAANQVLALMNDSHARMKAAMTPPPPVPDLPPMPDEGKPAEAAE